MTSGQKNKMNVKKGAKFERLIARIQKSVHAQAEIKSDEKLIDIHTGQKRQVDVTIRLSDGPTEFLGIVEVRDRSRPVGVGYVEEIASKRTSVKADAAFIVSQSGYAQAAIKKANELGIRLLSYEQALERDWSNWITCKCITALFRKYDNAVVTLCQKDEPTIGVTLSEKSKSAYINDKSLKIILDKEGNEFCSFLDLIHSFIVSSGDEAYKQVPEDGSRVRVLFDAGEKIEPAMFLRNSKNELIQLGNIKLEVDLYYEVEEHPITLTRYKEVNSDKSIAELATATIKHQDRNWQLEILAPAAGDRINNGLKLHVSTTQIEKDI